MNNLVGDVSTAARILPLLEGDSLTITKGKGAYLWDIHGKRYVDTALGFGAILVGHADSKINADVVDALTDGANLSWAHKREKIAASVLTSFTENLNKVMFVNSGSEAVHLACRAARAFTGKNKIAKAAAGFDGWFDAVTLGNINTQEATFEASQRPSRSDFTVFHYNDFEDIEKLFEEDQDIAAILVEPMLANAGCIMARDNYLQHLQDIAHKNGSLLICDEVLMGFRLEAKLASHCMGLKPDIVTVGKAIGNGIPVAAVISTQEILKGFEENKVARGGTYSGNPVGAQAVISTLEILKNSDFKLLKERGNRLIYEITKIFRENNIVVSMTGFGNVFTIWLGEQSPMTYKESIAIANSDFSRDLHLELRREGLLIMPSPYGRIYISFEHDESILAEMLEAFKKAVLKLSKYKNLDS